MDSCLHVHTGVSYIENIFFGCLCYFQDIVYDGGIGFYIYPFTLAEDGDETNCRKIVGNKFLCSCLIFVGSDCELQSLGL